MTMPLSFHRHNNSNTTQQPVVVHAALILANAMFGLGSIIGALGLPATNPLAFTAIREVVAGCLLLLVSLFLVIIPTTTTNTTTLNCRHRQDSIQEEKNNSGDNQHVFYHYLFPRSLHHFQKFCIIAFFMFCNQSCYIVGIQLAGPVTASVWQPSAPSFTAALAMLWGLEPWSVRRLSGVLVAFGGCAAMVLLTNRQDDTTHGGTVSFLIGNLLFFVNCSSTACYILLSKELLQLDYPSLTVIGLSYLLAATGMFAATLASACLPVGWFCTTNCSTTTHGTFYIPRETLPALAYYILAMSVGSWGLIVWSNQYATGTLVMGYSVLQPVTSLIFAVLLLLLGWVVQCGIGDESSTTMGDTAWCLNEPGVGTLCGMVGVFCGLSLIITTEPTTARTKMQDDNENDGNLTEYGTLPTSSSSST